MDWQPIETAPKDGTKILTCVEAHIAIGSWWPDDTIEAGGTWRDDGADPTHWMPLPEPPKATP